MELINPHFWTAAGDFMFGVVLTKGYILAAVIVGLGLTLRGASAAVRCAFWVTGAMALLLLPALSGRMPVWEVGVAAFPERLFAASAAGVTTGSPGMASISWLAVIWVAGSVALLVRFGIDMLRITRRTRRACAVRGHLAELADGVATELGVRRVRVALSDSGVPLTWGGWRPVVLLPREAITWPQGLQRAVLQHEMAHIKRGDYLGLLALELCRVFHWPNPFVWHLLRRARIDQELACDDAAIRSGIAPSDYARHLVAVARTFALGTPAPVGALPVVGASPLATRVAAALQREANRRPLTLRTAAVAIALITASALPVAAANLWSCPGPTASPPVVRPTAVLKSVAGPAVFPRLDPVGDNVDVLLDAPAHRLSDAPPGTADCQPS